MFQTLISNIDQLLEDIALKAFSNQIPAVIKDTMKVVASLGERYFWIDALCIVQEDELSLKQISRMDANYRQAPLAIIAIGSNNSDVGLPVICPNSRPIRQVCYNIQGISFTTKLTGFSRLLEKSRWGSRAWNISRSNFLQTMFVLY